LRIVKVEIKTEISGLSPFIMGDLGQFVVLAGENGSGKTRLLKMLEENAKFRKNKACGNKLDEFINISYTDNKGSLIEEDVVITGLSISNYSHSDLPLQPASDFPPYVINVSKNNLQDPKCNFGQTAQEALLYLTRLSRYEHDEMQIFNEQYCKPLLGYPLECGERNEPLLFGYPISELSKKPLSPGQKYLLRLCVALNCNVIPKDGILFLDEPETHLHPKVLLNLFDKLKNMVNLGQIWIATHSIELISHFWHSDVWYMIRDEHQKCSAKPMGSKSKEILQEILGDEIKRYHLHQFVTSPDIFVINAFAVECLCHSKVVQEAKENDPTASQARGQIQKDDIIVDYGAGKGRFLESYYSCYDRLEINYYAYDEPERSEEDGKNIADCCIATMRKYGISADNYYKGTECFEALVSVIPEKANKVLLINVLHEINPNQWEETFKKINRLLNNDGYLVIVEREELTVGEKPSDSGFFVLQKESLCVLFACKPIDFETISHPNESKKVVTHIIPKRLLECINKKTVKGAIDKIKEIAEAKIRRLKEQTAESSWERGVALAFWSHQFINAYLFNSR